MNWACASLRLWRSHTASSRRPSYRRTGGASGCVAPARAHHPGRRGQVPLVEALLVNPPEFRFIVLCCHADVLLVCPWRLLASARYTARDRPLSVGLGSS